MYVTVQFHCHPEKFHLSPSNKVSISELLTLLVAVLGASSYLLTPLLCWCYCGFTATLCTVVVLLFKIQGYFIMWLPISERIQYKVACICFNAINGSGPAYLCKLLHVYNSVSYTTLFFWHPQAENPTMQTQDSWLSHLLLLWTPHLEFTPTRP